MPEPVIYHVDVNSAFLSWEAARRLAEAPDSPDIRTFPAAIGGDETTRHGIVLAKSPSAKKYGVKTGEPLAQARRKCPQLQIYPPDYSLYVRRSHEFIELLRRYAPDVEAYSIDEAFCDMSGTGTLYGDLTLFAHRLKDIIENELAFTVNIGVSSNRLLAKMASDFEKPNKVHTLFTEEVPLKLWPLPIERLFFVGPSTSKKLRALGIDTIGALANADYPMIVSTFKAHGDTIWHYANGIESADLTHTAPANKGYGNSVTLPFDVTDTDTAKHILLSLSETVGARLRMEKAYISVVQLQMVDAEFHHYSRQMTLPSSTNVTEKIYACACSLLDHFWRHTPLRLLGVYTSRATADCYEQYNLFDMDKYERLSKLNSAVDTIRTRFGEDSIKRACFLEGHSKTDLKSGPNPHTAAFSKNIPHMTSGMNKAKREKRAETDQS